QTVGVDFKFDLTPEEISADKIVPVRKKPTPAFGGRQGPPPDSGRDAAQASRTQYDALEMRGFADGKRSILEIRDALSAEYGQKTLESVLTFFQGLEKTGEFALTQR